MTSELNRKAWKITYDNHEGNWTAEFILEDIEGDRFVVHVFTYGNGEYEMTIGTEEESYIKMGLLEINNLNLCLKRAVRELNRFKEEDND